MKGKVQQTTTEKNMHNNSWFLYGMAIIFLPIIALHKAAWWAWGEMHFHEHEDIPQPIEDFERWLSLASPKQKIEDIVRYPKLMALTIVGIWAALRSRGDKQPSHEEAVEEALEDQKKYGIPPQ